jgi:hypothetical protein
VLDQVGFSHAPLSNKLQKKLMHMLGAHLNKNERAMLQACWERIARCVAASRKGILRGECDRKPCANGMWCQEKVIAASGAFQLHSAIAKPCAWR